MDSPPELTFRVERVEPDRYAAAPTLLFGIAIGRVGGGPVRSIALNVQIRIAATRRSYDASAQEALVELFGRPGEWGRSLRSLPWTITSVHVPAFEDETLVDVPIACTYDFEVATSKYLHALRDGEVPLELLFTGTIFYAGDGGQLRIAHVPWEKEAEHRMPVAVWREMMDRYFPGSAWLRLRTETFDRLYAHRARGGFTGWDEAIDALLPADAEPGEDG
jgi:hypothetical protein